MRIICAWGVHLLTATGVIWSLLAMQAAIEHDFRAAFGWLLVAVLVDAVDGTLARIVRVKEFLPEFDGALLDNVIDYVSYVIVPVFLMLQSDLLSDRVGIWLAGSICVASAYQFCQADAKTPDHSFKGFPSYWNVAVLYLLALKLSPVWNAFVLAVLIVLVFVPIKYLYPTRSLYFRKLTILLTCGWGILAAMMIWQLPDPNRFLVHGSMLYFVYYVGMSLYLMRRQASALS